MVQVRLCLNLMFKLESSEWKQEEKRLVVPVYQLSNGGITASLFFRRCFQTVFKFVRDLLFQHVFPVLSSGPFNLIWATLVSRFVLDELTFASTFCAATLWYLQLGRTPFYDIWWVLVRHLRGFSSIYLRLPDCVVEIISVKIFCMKLEKFPNISLNLLLISFIHLFCSSKSLTSGRIFRRYTWRSRRYWCCSASPLPSSGLDNLQEWLT